MFDNSFWGYAYYEQKKEDAVQEICNRLNSGETNFTIDVDSNFTSSDIEEIKREANRRMGF